MKLDPDGGFIQCSCFGHALHVFRDTDTGELYFSMFERKGRNYGWRQRLRHIWRIIRLGYPYEDEAILTRSDARRLANWILKNTK